MEAEFKRVLDNCLDILRDNEGLTGEKALRNMSYFLTLALIEPRLESLNLFDPTKIDIEVIPTNEIVRYQKYIVFSNLVNSTKDEQKSMIITLNSLWSDVLSRHPSTKSIFLEEKKFDIQHKKTMVKLVQKVGTLGLNNPNIVDYDLLGAAYERVTGSIMTGKVLGQFFTPACLKGVMLDFIQPRVFDDGTCESVCDPTMGTAGFLTKYFRHISEQAKARNIKLNVNKIVENGLIYGKEIETDTFQLAVSNMLISTGHIFKNLERGDSIRKPIAHMKFDHVMANPPFGIKGLKYDEFKSPLKSEYIPIKSDNAVSLFMQAIIFMLKVNGRAAVILPDGQDIFSKTNRTLVAVREILLKTCDLQQIISVPSGVFENTAIKTCIFCFVKRKEMKEVLRVEITKRVYKYYFSREHATQSVAFFSLDKDTLQKTLVVTVSMDTIAENAYSLNVAEYTDQKVSNSLGAVTGDIAGLGKGGMKFEVRTLGEICGFKTGKCRNAKDGQRSGLYKFFTASTKDYLYLNDYDYEEDGLIINSVNGSGKCMVYHSKYYSVTTNNIHFTSVNEISSNRFIYFYLFFNIQLLENGFQGCSQKKITKDYISNIKIPLPPLPIQQQIVDYLDFIYEKSIKSSQEKIAQLKRANEYAIKNQIEFGQNEVRTLGEMFTMEGGKFNSGHMDNTGDIPFYSCKAKNPSGFHSVESFDKPEYLLIICGGGSQNNLTGDNVGLGKCYYVRGKAACRSNVYALFPNGSSSMSLKYVCYYLNIYRYKTVRLAHFTTSLGIISSKDLYKITIAVPPIKVQQQIVEYCEANQKLIESLEAEIAANKLAAKNYLATVLGTNNDDSLNTLSSPVDMETSDSCEIAGDYHCSPAKRSRKLPDEFETSITVDV